MTIERVCAVSIDVEPDLFNSNGAEGLRGMDGVLQTMESFGIRCTLFATGSIVERHPSHFVRWSEKHEIATHGYTHRRLDKLDLRIRRSEIRKCVELWQRVLNEHPDGFRAVEHTIDDAQLRLLAAEGFRYDSSVVPDYPLKGRIWKYAGYLGPAPSEPYFVNGLDSRRTGSNRFAEVPVTPGPLGLPFQGTWIRLLGPSLYTAIARVTRQQFIHFSFHSWDTVRFSGVYGIRSGPPFGRMLEKLLGILTARFEVLSCDRLLSRLGEHSESGATP